MGRKSLPVDIEVEVLTRSRRRCCLCWALDSDAARKKGQIAHINKNKDDNRRENLAFLCLNHHDEYDSTTSQTKGLTAAEICQYRDDLYIYVDRHLALSVLASTQAAQQIDFSRILSTSGDFLEYSRQFQKHRLETAESLRDYENILAETIQNMRDWKEATPVLKQNPSKVAIRGHFNKIGTSLAVTASKLNEKMCDISQTTVKMLAALEAAFVLASDFEFVTLENFQKKSADLARTRDGISHLIESAEGAAAAVKGWRRTTGKFNKGRRLFVASINGFCEELKRQVAAMRDQELVLEELMELL